MHIYETVLAVAAVTGQDKKEESIHSVEKIVEKEGGSITSSSDMGEKKMAYKVKNHDRAYYHLIEFEAPGSVVEKLKRHYRLSDEYIRSIVVRKG
ncbi:MAG: 30S ribosomal protein S6 [Elusimicrobia bacterium]|nr:30S ribosomal protein S6 [Elusimicrobiota bacterium]